MCRQQIALHALGDETQPIVVRALLLALQSSGNPARQLGRTGWNDLDGHSRFGKGLEPDRFLFRPVEAGQRYQQQSIR